VSFVSYRKNRSSNKTSPEDEHEDILWWKKIEVQKTG
jgi:hypothetical protein